MGNGATAVLEPTFRGYVASTTDALILFEACLSGILHHVPRRPHDRERATLVRSGSVFIYEENASGIKRWTDGVTWSPSRILGNFLVYRELDKPFPPGEKKRAMKKGARRPPQPSRPGEPYPRPQQPAQQQSQAQQEQLPQQPQQQQQPPAAQQPQQPPQAILPPPSQPSQQQQQQQQQQQPQPQPHPQESNGTAGYSPTTPSSAGGGGGGAPPGAERMQQSELERALVGSLVDSYGFKESGLVKKTMSVTVSGVTHHLVSYYSVEDVMRGMLPTPSMVETLRQVRPRPELTTKQSFRAPIDDMEHPGMDEPDTSPALYAYRQTMGGQGYAVAPPSAAGYYTLPPGAGYPPQPQPLSGYAVPPGQPPPPPSGIPAHHPAGGAANPYMATGPAASADMPPKTEEYSAFRGHPASAYPAGFDPMGQQAMPHMPPPPPPPHPPPAGAGAGAPGISPASRTAPQPSPPAGSPYRQSSFSSGRSIDPSAPADPNVSGPPPPSYSSRGGSFSMQGGGGSIDGGPPPPHQQLEHPGSVGGGSSAGFDPMAAGRRDSGVISAAGSYYSAGSGDSRRQAPQQHHQQQSSPPQQHQQHQSQSQQPPTLPHPQAQQNNHHPVAPQHHPGAPPPGQPQRSSQTPPQPSPSQQSSQQAPHYFVGTQGTGGHGVYPGGHPHMSTWNGTGSGQPPL